MMRLSVNPAPEPYVHIAACVIMAHACTRLMSCQLSSSTVITRRPVRRACFGCSTSRPSAKPCCWWRAATGPCRHRPSRRYNMIRVEFYLLRNRIIYDKPVTWLFDHKNVEHLFLYQGVF